MEVHLLVHLCILIAVSCRDCKIVNSADMLLGRVWYGRRMLYGGICNIKVVAATLIDGQLL